MASSLSLKASEKIELISNLSTMLSSGIPILEAVNSIAEDTKGNQKKVLDALKQDLMQGKQIYTSLSRFPRSFDKVTVNLIRAAEEAGTLDVTLKDLRQHIQSETEFSDKIKFALIYPIMILIVFFGVLLMILVFVIPKISQVFLRLKVDLPLPTKLLVIASDLVVKHTVWVVSGFSLFVGLIFLLFRYRKQWVLEFFYRLPLVSRLIKEIDLTRFTRSLYLLLASGVPITTALELTKDVVLRAKTSAIISKSREMVMGGKKLSEGFRIARGSIPSLMIKLVEAGEKSGKLEESMHEISDNLDYQVSNTLKTVVAVMEPLMLILVSISVGGMMVAIIAPIYGIIGKVGGR